MQNHPKIFWGHMKKWALLLAVLMIVVCPSMEGRADAGGVETSDFASEIPTLATKVIEDLFTVWKKAYDLAKDPLERAIKVLQEKLKVVQSDAIGKAAALNADLQTKKAVTAAETSKAQPDNHRTCNTVAGINAMEVSNRTSRIVAAQMETSSIQAAMTTNPSKIISARQARDVNYGFLPNPATDPKWLGRNGSSAAVFNPNGFYNLPHGAAIVNGFFSLPSTPPTIDGTICGDQNCVDNEINYVAAYTFCERLQPTGMPMPTQVSSPTDLIKFDSAQERMILQGTAYHDCMDAIRMRTAVSQAAATAIGTPGIIQWYQSQVRQCRALNNKNMISANDMTNCSQNGMSQLMIDAYWHGYGAGHNMVPMLGGTQPDKNHQADTGLSDENSKGISAEESRALERKSISDSVEFERQLRQEERELDKSFTDGFKAKEEDKKSQAQ